MQFNDPRPEDPQSPVLAEESGSGKTKDIFLQALKFCVFFGLGIFIIWFFQQHLSAEEKTEIGLSLRSARWRMVIWVAVFGLLSNVFRTLRWNILLEPMGYNPRFRNTFCSVLVAYFANLAIPRLGEVLRCTFLYRYEKVPVQKSLGTVVSERVIDILCFLLIFIVSFAIKYRYLDAYVRRLFNRSAESGGGSAIFVSLSVMVAVVLLIAGFVLYYRRYRERFRPGGWMGKVAGLLKGFGEGFMSLRHIRKPWLFFFCTLGLWLCYWLMMYFSFRSLQDLADAGFGIALIALAMGTFGVIITPGGIGVYPVIISETLSAFGIAKTLGYTAGWISWGTQTALIIVAGLAALLLFPLINRKK